MSLAIKTMDRNFSGIFDSLFDDIWSTPTVRSTAIINKPKIIFADEPTGNLDGENILNMSKLILEFNSKHKTSFIIATHDAKICDIGNKIYCLDDGILTLENRN